MRPVLVFIDESGDSGFNTAKGASAIFVAAMVIFENREQALQSQTAIEQSAVRRVHKTEFKFNKCSDDIRDRFFSDVCRLPFTVRAIVVRKERIYSPRLKSDKESFYEFFVRMMMTHDNGILQNARVIIDGSGDRKFRLTLKSEPRRRTSNDAVKDVSLKNSENDVLVQLADMCAGAIARSYRNDRPRPWR
jgi:Protein of unknown function (DUF3800)